MVHQDDHFATTKNALKLDENKKKFKMWNLAFVDSFASSVSPKSFRERGNLL